MPRLLILIKEIRKSRGMSIRELSKKSGISRTEISRIELEEVSPTLDTLLQLANALNVDIKNTFDVTKG